eukprot:7613755-Pyramimonas_sp.AAC.1
MFASPPYASRRARSGYTARATIYCNMGASYGRVGRALPRRAYGTTTLVRINIESGDHAPA